jgi:hypothetical protein
MPVDYKNKSAYHNDRSTGDGAPENLTAPQALSKIRQIASVSDNIVVVPHGKKRATQRSVPRRQIERCIRMGTIREGPFRNAHGNWQVTLYRHAAGDELTCVVAIDWPTRVIVITTYR